MNSLWKKTDLIFDRIIFFLYVFASALIVFIIFAICFTVGSKLFTGKSLSWITEIVEYSIPWITFLGSAWVLKVDAHIKMDLVLTRLNDRNQALLNAVTSLLGAILCLIMTVYSARVTWEHLQTNYRFVMFLRPPAALIDFIIPLGFILLVLQFIRRACSNLEAFSSLDKQVANRK